MVNRTSNKFILTIICLIAWGCTNTVNQQTYTTSSTVTRTPWPTRTLTFTPTPNPAPTITLTLNPANFTQGVWVLNESTNSSPALLINYPFSSTIEVVSVDGKLIQRIIFKGYGILTGSNWVNGGCAIAAFLSDRDGWSMIVIDNNGNVILEKKPLFIDEPDPFTEDKEYVYPILSPDGAYLSYSVWSDLLRVGGSHQDVELISMQDPLIPVRVSRNGGVNLVGGSWSPDGELFAFPDYDFAGTSQLFIWSRTTGNIRQMTAFPRTEDRIYSMAWARDSDHLIIDVWDSEWKWKSIYIVSISDAIALPVTISNIDSPSAFAWSIDGGYFFVALNNTQGFIRIDKISMENGNTVASLLINEIDDDVIMYGDLVALSNDEVAFRGTNSIYGYGLYLLDFRSESISTFFKMANYETGGDFPYFTVVPNSYDIHNYATCE